MTSAPAHPPGDPSRPATLKDRRGPRSNVLAFPPSGSFRPAPRRRTPIYLGLTIALVLANAVVYRIHRARKQAAPPAPAAALAPKPPPAAPPGPAEEPSVVRAHRLAGLAALEQGDLALAERELQEAQRLEPQRAELKDLMRIVRNLQSSRRAKAEAPKPPEPAPAPPPPAPRAKAPPPPRVIVVAKADPPKPAPEPPEKGTLLVVSTPSGLLVHVNGQPADVTPARIPVSPGLHSVALVRGDARLYERLVRVSSTGVASVDADVTAQLAPARPAPEPAPEPPPKVAEPEPAPPPPAAEPRRASAETGELYVTSPEIYGEIFINGRRFGFPPVLAKGLPAGPATVEVRVNDVPRRTMSLEVQAGRRLALRLR